MHSLTRFIVFAGFAVMLCACTGAPVVAPPPAPELSTPTPKSTQTSVADAKGSHGTSLTSCAQAEVSGATGKAKDWLVEKGMELANKLPGYFSEWAKSGEQFGEGSLSGVGDLVTGLSLRVELVSSGASPGMRWVFLIVSSQDGSAAGVTPAPTQASGSGDESYTFILRAERFDTETGQWTAVCEDIVTPPELPVASPDGVTPSTEPTVQVLINARCRLGPSLDYPVVAFFSQGDVLRPTGRNQNGTWCQVPMNASTGVCWLAGNLTEPNCSLLDLPYTPAPPLPTAAPTHVSVHQNPQLQQGCLYNGICHHWTCGPNDPPNAVSCSY
jgi:hypothetical protein